MADNISKSAESLMLVRISLAACSVALISLALWMATHESPTPEVLGRYSRAYFAVLMLPALLGVAGLALQRSALCRKVQRFRGEIAVAAFSVAASLTVVEIAVRILDPAGISYFEEVSRYHLEKVADPILVYKHEPGIRRRYQGVEVATNEIGLRERPIAPKQPGEMRVLLLGDSVVFGWGVAVEKTAGRRLEALLASALARPVTVINSGVGSYNTVQQLAFLEQRGREIAPDAVVLLYVENDIDVKEATFDPLARRSLRGKSPPEVLTLLVEKSWTYRLALFARQYVRAGRTENFDPNARGVAGSMQALSNMAAYCRDHGLQFHAFYYRARPAQPSESAPLLALVKATAQRASITAEDVSPWWQGRDMRSVTNSIVDSHPNEHGHDVLARGMARSLIERGIAAAMRH